MRYEAPSITDYGSITEHTFQASERSRLKSTGRDILPVSDLGPSVAFS
jgi:hypothetical protein